MKPIRDSALFQKLSEFAFQATGQTFALAVALFLIVAWMVTGPIFHVCDKYLRRRNNHHKQWKMKGAL